MNNMQFYSILNSIERYLNSVDIEYSTNEEGGIYIPEINIDGDLFQMGVFPNLESHILNIFLDYGLEVDHAYRNEVLKYINLANSGKHLGLLYIDEQNDSLIQKIQMVVTGGTTSDDYWEHFFDQMALDYAVYVKGARLITEMNMGGR